MKNRDIEAHIKSAVEQATPDLLNHILARCGKQQGSIYVIHPDKPKKRRLNAIAALAAAVVFIFGGLFAFSRITGGMVDTRIMLDVNPSLEIRLNNRDRVVSVTANNQDAVKILDHMDLKNTPVDVAINALIGSMLKYGYIQEDANSVLLSVEGVDGEKSAALQKNLTQSIGLQLSSVNGAVISQNLVRDEAIQKLADEFQISYGKAALVQKIVDANSHLLFADLAELPVNELNLLFSSKQMAAEGTESRGSASDTGYIGEARAKQAALNHAGLGESETEALYAELDYDDGQMVYDVEFYYGGQEYEYEISALDGSVVDYSRESMDGRRKPEDNAGKTQDRSDFIGEERAAEIAVRYQGGLPYEKLKTELDKDDGLYVYEVEWQSGSQEYHCEIDAVTGEVLSFKSDND